MRYNAMIAGIFLACMGGLFTCKTKKTSERLVIKHLAEAGWQGSAGIYADRVPNRAILKEEGIDTAKTAFYCLRVGLYDSTNTTDAAQLAAKDKYYQLEMYKDWVLLCDQDSLAPVFYQPVPGREKQLTEQVLVYEIPKGAGPVSLVYKDPYGLLGPQHVLNLNEK